MSRALDLFRRLQAGGLPQLERLIADREPESLFLDFKTSPGRGAGAVLDASDNKNLSKGISGFGNSSGGILVWGVRFRREAGGGESADLDPLTDVLAFQTKVEGAISRLTLPAATEIETLVIPTGAGNEGVLVVHVPQSSIGPLRSVETNHYHYRSGSSFQIIGHDVLAGMFGRSPRPSISHVLTAYPARVEDRSNFFLGFSILATNEGAVLARKPCLAVKFSEATKTYWRMESKPGFTKIDGVLPTVSFIGADHTAVAPGGATGVCDVTLLMPVTQACDLNLECTLSADATLPQRFTISVSMNELLGVIERCQSGERIPTTDFLSIS